MTKGKKTLLVGAGAECAAPFRLPSGKQFTFDTCYYSNDALYEALAEFYRGRLADDKTTHSQRRPISISRSSYTRQGTPSLRS